MQNRNTRSESESFSTYMTDIDLLGIIGISLAFSLFMCLVKYLLGDYNTYGTYTYQTVSTPKPDPKPDPNIRRTSPYRD